jgi:hypothetical protein
MRRTLRAGHLGRFDFWIASFEPTSFASASSARAPTQRSTEEPERAQKG